MELEATTQNINEKAIRKIVKLTMMTTNHLITSQTTGLMEKPKSLKELEIFNNNTKLILFNKLKNKLGM